MDGLWAEPRVKKRPISHPSYIICGVSLSLHTLYSGLYLDMAVSRAFMLHVSVVIPHSCRGHQGNMARLLKRATVLAIRKQYDARYTITEIAKSLGRSQRLHQLFCQRDRCRSLHQV